VGQPVTEDALIGYVVGGLHPSFNLVVTSLSVASCYKSLTFSEFQDELLSYELLLDSQTASNTENTHQFAMFSSKPTANNYNRKAKASGKRWNGPKSTSSSPKFQPPSSSSPARPPCQICGKLSHQALDCFHRMDHAFQGRHPSAQLSTMVATFNQIADNSPWYADSVANQHIIANLENLSLQQPYSGSDDVAVGNDTGLSIQNTGSMSFHTPKSSFHLSQGLNCPKAYANLRSINQFCRDNDCFFLLNGSHYFVKDNHTSLTLLEGLSEGGLYPLHFKSLSVNKQHALTAFLGVKTFATVWHSRLGHASQPVVSHLLQQFSLPISGVKHLDGVCESCQLGKSKQLPFQPSPHVSLCPLDLIHLDVWSCSTKSLGGCSYYDLFIDDFSKFTWLYPIHNKSDVFQVFVQFKSLVENQFPSSTKQFQCDGGEYMSNQFKNFLVTHGILHHVSCPHTPQQMVWPSVSIALSWKWVYLCLLNHIFLPFFGLMLLSHLFLSSIGFLSSVLGDVSPFFKLFNNGPDYSLFHSFGCSSFPLLRPYSTHKLMFRSKHCIFLGYSSNQRGYRCLDPASRKAYVSRHVFDESRFLATEGILSNFAPADSVSTVSFPAFPSFHSPSSVQITPIPIVVPPCSAGSTLTSTECSFVHSSS